MTVAGKQNKALADAKGVCKRKSDVYSLEYAYVRRIQDESLRDSLGRVTPRYTTCFTCILWSLENV